MVQPCAVLEQVVKECPWCYAITVAGLTIASSSRHRDHVRESTTQNARPSGRSRGAGSLGVELQAVDEAQGFPGQGSRGVGTPRPLRPQSPLEPPSPRARLLRSPAASPANRPSPCARLVDSPLPGIRRQSLENEFLTTTGRVPITELSTERTCPTGPMRRRESGLPCGAHAGPPRHQRLREPP